MRTEAQKRANQKYKKNLKQWKIDLKPELYDEIEKARKEKGLFRREVLEEWLKQNK